MATLALIGYRRRPWRATRWAWLWLILTPAGPLVAVGYLTLGGATGILPPARPERRLTGGWAFLVASMVVGASAPTTM